MKKDFESEELKDRFTQIGYGEDIPEVQVSLKIFMKINIIKEESFGFRELFYSLY